MARATFFNCGDGKFRILELGYESSGGPQGGECERCKGSGVAFRDFLESIFDAELEAEELEIWMLTPCHWCDAVMEIRFVQAGEMK